MLFRTLAGNGDDVTLVAFSPDGKTMASGSKDGTMQLWDAQTGELKHTLRERVGMVTSITFSPDGKTLASGSRFDRSTLETPFGEVQLWDVQTKTLRRTLGGHVGMVTSITFSPDGKTLASGSRFDGMTPGESIGEVRLWDVQTGKLKHTLKGDRDGVNSVAFSPDGKTVAIASGAFNGSKTDGDVKLWDAQTRKLKRTLERHFGGIYAYSVAFSPDGETVAAGDWQGTVSLWDVKTGKLKRTLEGHNGSVSVVAFSPNGKTVAGGGGDTVRLWDIQTGKLKRTMEKGGLIVVESVAFSPDGKTLAIGSDVGTVRLWSVLTSKVGYKVLRTQTGHGGPVHSVAFSPNGETLASGSDIVVLWEVQTEQTAMAYAVNTTSVAFSPDGKTLAIGSHDGTVRLWTHTHTWELFNLGFTIRHKHASVAFSPDGKTGASGSGEYPGWGRVVLWEAQTGKLLRTLTDSGPDVTSVAFSPDGKTVVSGSYDSTVRLWDAHTGELKRTLIGDKYAMLSVAFSPDGKTLAIGSADGMVRLFLFS